MFFMNYEILLMISLMFFLTYVFFVNGNSFISSLLTLESISLIIYFILVFLMYSFFSLKVLFIYLVLIVSESSIGLSILVKSVKFYGSANFKSMNLSMF